MNLHLKLDSSNILCGGVYSVYNGLRLPVLACHVKRSSRIYTNIEDSAKSEYLHSLDPFSPVDLNNT